ncbi:MAG: hypothetical protein J6Y01_08255, partial [Spirochaetales bacterium]|nr:hypothetical protein [Spirochaetales bacterium]
NINETAKHVNFSIIIGDSYNHWSNMRICGRLFLAEEFPTGLCSDRNENVGIKWEGCHTDSIFLRKI